MITKQKLEFKDVTTTEKPSSNAYKQVEWILFYGGASYLILLAVNIILSSFFGYSLVSNYVSDLGSTSVIPFPFIHDLICVFGGIISLPINFFVRKKLRIVYKNSRYSFFCAEVGLALGVAGNVGYAFIGVFSLDRAGPGDAYHGIVALLAFIGYVLSIFFFSLNIVLSHKCKLRRLGFYGLIVPVALFSAYCVFTVPLIEWLLFISILAFLFLLNFYVLKL